MCEHVVQRLDRDGVEVCETCGCVLARLYPELSGLVMRWGTVMDRVGPMDGRASRWRCRLHDGREVVVPEARILS